MRTDYAVKIPYALGLIATRSTTKEVTGLKDLMQQHEVRIRNGMLAYAELEKLRAGDRSPELLASFEKNQKDLGYGLLLKKYAPNVVDASEQHIQAAVKILFRMLQLCFLFPCNGCFWLLNAAFHFSNLGSSEKKC